MSRIEEFSDLSESEADELVIIYKKAGATKVEKIKQDNENWTVRATLPD
jgi:hypothetical protein